MDLDSSRINGKTDPKAKTNGKTDGEQAGRRAWFDKLADPERAPALRMAQQYCASREDAEDAVQEAMVRAYQALAQYDARLPFSPWFRMILRNILRDRHRGSARARELLGRGCSWEDCPEDTGVRSPTPLEEQVRLALLSLPRPQQAILRLHFVEQMSFRDLSKRTGRAVAELHLECRMATAALKGLLEGLSPVEAQVRAAKEARIVVHRPVPGQMSLFESMDTEIRAAA